MDASRRRRHPSTRRGVCQKAHQRLALGCILDTAHRHPEARKHLGGIGEEAFEALGIPTQTVIARLAQHRRVIESGVAADPTPDHARKVRAGQSPLGGIEAMAGAAGSEQPLAVFLGARGSSRADRERYQDYEKSHAGATVWITTSRLVPDSPPQASPGRPFICRTFAPALSLGKALNFSVSGSKRTIALAEKSVSQTLSLSST